MFHSDTRLILVRNRLGIPFLLWAVANLTTLSIGTFSMLLFALAGAAPWLFCDRWYLRHRHGYLSLVWRRGHKIEQTVAWFTTGAPIAIRRTDDVVTLSDAQHRYSLRCESPAEAVQVAAAMRIRCTSLGVEATLSTPKYRLAPHYDTFRPLAFWTFIGSTMFFVVMMAFNTYWMMLGALILPLTYLAYTFWARYMRNQTHCGGGSAQKPLMHSPSQQSAVVSHLPPSGTHI